MTDHLLRAIAKDVAVRDCVANSGLHDVYDATIGLSNSAE